MLANKFNNIAMKFLSAFYVFIFTSLLLTSCYDDPDFGNEPRLTYIDVYFRENAPGTLDSLVVIVNFEDGDGDLGIIQGEPGYELYTRIPSPPPDSKPYWVYDADDDRMPEYNCVDYEFAPRTEGDSIRDTLYVERNEAYYNYSLNLFTKVEDQFLEVDRFCAPPLGGQFFPLKDNLNTDGPLRGTLVFGTEDAYKAQFRNDTLKAQVIIRDRAGNVSNAIETDPFTLNDIAVETDTE